MHPFHFKEEMLRHAVLFAIIFSLHSSAMKLDQNHTAVTKTEDLQIEPSKTLISESAFNGSSVTLPCNVPGNYTVNHLWWFNGNILFSKGFNPIEIGISNVVGKIMNSTSSYIQIEKFSVENVGNYSCSVRDITEIHFSLNLNSTSSALIELYILCMYKQCPEKLVLQNDSVYEFQCFSNAVPIESLSWSVNGVNVSDNVKQENMSLVGSSEDTTVSVLTLDPEFDYMNISCSAKNIEKTVYLYVAPKAKESNQPTLIPLVSIIAAVCIFVFLLVILVFSIAFKLGNQRGSSRNQVDTQNTNADNMMMQTSYLTAIENCDYGDASEYAYVDDYNKLLKPRLMYEDISFESDMPPSSKAIRWIGTFKLSDGKLERVVVCNIKDYSNSVLRLLWKEYLELVLTLPDHSNILGTVGYYTTKGYTYAIQEYSSAGTLKSHLSSEYGNLSNTKSSIVQGAFLRFSSDIINGMEYLASKGCSHPGLRCNKVLLNGFQVCKIYDFCSNKSAMKVVEFYIGEGDDSAIKSFAPENIFLGEYSRSSDVWALGLTLWEIYSGGEDPFRLVKKDDFERLLNTRVVLGQPTDCPDNLFAVMKRCWSKKCPDRPKLCEIKSTFEGTRGTSVKDKSFQPSSKMSDQFHAGSQEQPAVYNQNIY